MDKLYLIATIAGQPIAIRAALVNSVVDVGEISPVPLAARHVAGLAALRSRVLTIICCESALGFTPRPNRSQRAVVVTVDNHSYGLLVGTIDDARVIEQDPTPIRIRLATGWARVAIGMLDYEGEGVLLIDPEKLVAGPDELAA